MDPNLVVDKDGTGRTSVVRRSRESLTRSRSAPECICLNSDKERYVDGPEKYSFEVLPNSRVGGTACDKGRH